jgi:Putative DNA-binding domain
MPKSGKRNAIALALAATREVRTIDFKSAFNPAETRDWVELIKDVMAFANSGGGVIVFGEDNNGKPIAGGADKLLAVDPAELGNKLVSYTGSTFDDLSIRNHDKDGIRVATLTIGEAQTPILPTRPGTYEKDKKTGEQKNVFSIGVVYVRHGAKSEPANSADLARVIDRRVQQLRGEWLNGVKKITTAPLGSQVVITKATAEVPVVAGQEVRLVIDPKASPSGVPDFDKTHPHRMTELLKFIKTKVTGVKVTVADIHTVLAADGKEDDPAFTWKHDHGVRQYTNEFANWLIEQIQRDPRYCIKAKSRLRRMGGRTRR